IRPLGRGPTILTIAVTTETLPAAVYQRIRRFVAHSTTTVEELAALGVERSRIHLIYPGVNLERFQPRPRAAALPLEVAPTGAPGRFRILFATTPNTIDGLRTRGVHLLLEAARRMPEIDFILPWRPWAGADAVIDACRANAPANFHASKALIPDISDVFQAVD